MRRRKKHTPEQIINLLREIEVAVAGGRTVVELCREEAITEQAYFRWRNEYGALKLEQVRRLKELEKENARLPEGPVDIVISHTCPTRFLDGLGKLALLGNDKVDGSTCSMLDAIFEQYRPKPWYFGHWHIRRSGETDDCRWGALGMLPKMVVKDKHMQTVRDAWAWLEG